MAQSVVDVGEIVQHLQRIYGGRLTSSELSRDFITKLEENVTVNVMVIGITRSGKSMFICKLLNFANSDPKAPKYGRTNAERTEVMLHHQKHSLPGIRITDAMGIGFRKMANLSPKEYCDKLKACNYDAFILVTSGSFSDDELGLYRYITKLQKPCFLVVTHFDQVIADEMEKDESFASEDEAASIARQKINEQIKSRLVEKRYISQSDLDSVKIYCVDNRKPAKFDFELLKEDLRKNKLLEKKKRDLLKQRLFFLSEESLQARTRKWRKILLAASTGVGAAGASPIPGTDIVVQISVIVSLLIQLHREYGLTESALYEVCDTYGIANREAAVKAIQAKFKYTVTDVEAVVSRIANWKDMEPILARFSVNAGVVAIATVNDVVKAFPPFTIIGMGLGVFTGYFTTLYWLSKILNGCEHDGLIVVREIRQRIAGSVVDA